MPDYQKMYAILCSSISDALDKLPTLPENTLSRLLLEEAIRKTEEIYINANNETQNTRFL